jgi:hypothetical protein
MQVARPAGGNPLPTRIGPAIGSFNASRGGAAAGRLGAPAGGSLGSPLPSARARIRNPARKREFTGTTAFTANVKTRRIAKAMVLAVNPPTVNRDGNTKLTCVSWHAKGMCFDDCERDHAVHTEAEATEFMAWCHIALA